MVAAVNLSEIKAIPLLGSLVPDTSDADDSAPKHEPLELVSTVPSPKGVAFPSALVARLLGSEKDVAG